MGVGYQASPLHRIVRLEPAGRGRDAVAGENMLTDALLKAGRQVTIQDEPARFRSPSVSDIVAWRNRLAIKYHDQLGEDLTWDKDSSFVQSEDTATSADVMLHYVAAVLDQRGSEARALNESAMPSYAKQEAVFDEAERRGFTGRFPQLLLGACYWLPFKRNMIIEEPDWDGLVLRFGSLFCLAEELRAVRVFIAETDQKATTWTAQRHVPRNDVLAAAWFASDTAARICASAVAQHLPFWTTG